MRKCSDKRKFLRERERETERERERERQTERERERERQTEREREREREKEKRDKDSWNEQENGGVQVLVLTTTGFVSVQLIRHHQLELTSISRITNTKAIQVTMIVVKDNNRSIPPLHFQQMNLSSLTSQDWSLGLKKQQLKTPAMHYLVTELPSSCSSTPLPHPPPLPPIHSASTGHACHTVLNTSTYCKLYIPWTSHGAQDTGAKRAWEVCVGGREATLHSGFGHDQISKRKSHDMIKFLKEVPWHDQISKRKSHDMIKFLKESPMTWSKFLKGSPMT